MEEPRATEAGVNMTALTEIGDRLFTFSLELTPAEEAEGSENPGPAL